MRQISAVEMEQVGGGFLRVAGAVIQVAKALFNASQTDGAVARADAFEEATGDNIYGGDGPKY